MVQFQNTVNLSMLYMLMKVENMNVATNLTTFTTTTVCITTTSANAVTTTMVTVND